MVSDSNAKYLQCEVALDFVDRYLDSIEDAFAKMVPHIPELAVMDEFCDTAEAVDFLRDTLNNLREKIEEKLGKAKRITRCSGDGQGTCARCSEKGKWNRSWMCFLYKIEGMEGTYCKDCVDEIMREADEA